MNYCNFCGRYDTTTTITLPDKYQRTEQETLSFTDANITNNFTVSLVGYPGETPRTEQQEERIVVDLCERCTNELEHEG
jgi:hypothetical protein